MTIKARDRHAVEKGIRRCFDKNGKSIGCEAKSTINKHSTYKRFKYVKDARQWRADRLSAAGKGELYSPSKEKRLVSEIAEAWINNLKKTQRTKRGKKVTPSTIQQYERHVAHIIAGLGEKKLKELSTEVNQEFIDTLQTLPGPEGNKQQRDANDNTKRYIGITLKAILNSVNKEDVCKEVNLPEGKAPKARPGLKSNEVFGKKKHVLTDFDIEKQILPALKGHIVPLATLALSRTGLRIGELAALQWKNIDFNSSPVKLTVDAEEGNATDKRELTPPKTDNSARTITLDDKLADALKEHKTKQRRFYKDKGVQFSSNWFVFPVPVTDPTRPPRPGSLASAIVYQVRHIEVKIDGSEVERFKEFHVHAFRHAHITYLLELQGREWTPQRVARRVGDTVKTIMEHYAHATTEGDINAAYPDTDATANYTHGSEINVVRRGFGETGNAILSTICY